MRPVALDPDAMNLAYGMHRFDIAHFNPHAPGYLVYVWALKAAHVVRAGADDVAARFATVQLVALLFALGSVVAVYAAARCMRVARGGAGVAALVLGLHPILLFHSVDAQTHTSEALASALLLLGALGYRSAPGWRRALLLGVLLAFGSALRPSFVVFGVPVVVWTVGLRRARDLFVAGAASVAGALAWVAPTVVASGGWETWRAATRGLVHHGFVLTSSPLSETAFGALVRANQLSLAFWSLEVLLPLLVAAAFATLASPSSEPRFTDADEGRWLRGALLIGGGLAVLYYAATFVSEPGYLAALLPPVALYVGALTGGSRGARAAALAVISVLLCWAIPVLPDILKVPSVPEWRRRTELAMAYQRHVESALPPTGRHLVLIDHPDITVGRQLPMSSERVDVLLIHDGRRPWVESTSLTFVTRDDSTPIPDVLGPTGMEPRVATSRTYDGVFYDGSLAAHFQAEIVDRSSCPVRSARDITETVTLPVRCLDDAILTLDGLSLEIGRPDAPAR